MFVRPIVGSNILGLFILLVAPVVGFVIDHVYTTSISSPPHSGIMLEFSIRILEGEQFGEGSAENEQIGDAMTQMFLEKVSRSQLL